MLLRKDCAEEVCLYVSVHTAQQQFTTCEEPNLPVCDSVVSNRRILSQYVFKDTISIRPNIPKTVFVAIALQAVLQFISLY